MKLSESGNFEPKDVLGQINIKKLMYSLSNFYFVFFIVNVNFFFVP